MPLSRFAKSAWYLVAYTLVVIIGGAFVRLSFSGDGCGDHWPQCGGTLTPDLTLASSKMLIEFGHRISSALYGFWVLGMVIAAFRIWPKGSIERKTASFTLLFTIFEALIGAVLVKSKHVGQDASPERALWLGIHLANTFMLIASAVMLAAWASGWPRKLASDGVSLVPAKPVLKGQGAVLWLIGLGMLSVVLVSVSGAITSLGDQLFPVASTPKAIQDAMDPTRHFLIQLRVLHPLIATSVGVYLVLLAGLMSHLRPSQDGVRLARSTVALYGVQIAFGLANVAFKAPTWMALVHLLIADLIWISFVSWTLSTLSEGVPHVEEVVRGASAGEKAGVRDYVALTKPRVISLLLFTTITALYAAAGGNVSLGLLLVVTLGGYMSAGAANAINMVIDRDIDGTMKRTATRPTVTQKIPSTHALLFAFALTVISFTLLWLGANMMAAMLSLAGMAFYVVIYTLMLKRRTAHNIVIGGAAGAFPPLVGWAAYDASLPPLAWVLFAIILVWTPVHFWALALMIKDEYASVNVPMLPVVRGDRFTVVQIVLYAIVTVAVSLAPFFMPVQDGPSVRYLYLVGAILLNVVLLARCYQLYRSIDRPHALKLFKYSMVYLAALFLLFAIDCSIPKGQAQPSLVTKESVHGPVI